MIVKCATCGTTYDATPNIDENEARYQGRLYEPVPVYCPECGSDELASGY